MNLGNELKKYMPATGDQKRVVGDWLEAAAKFEKPVPQFSTVQSQLSRCVNGDPAGVRYFFGVEARTITLFDAMRVPESERLPLRTRATAVLANGHARAARLVIDLTPWPEGGAAADKLFEKLKPVLLAEPRPAPILLVLTSGQYDRLPKSLSDLGDDLRCEIAEPGSSTDLASAAGQATVMSQRVFAPIERWVALEWDKGELRFEPADALRTLGRDGELPPPPRSPEHHLPATSDGETMRPPGDAIAIRKLAYDLADDTSEVARTADRETRRKWAAWLGVAAAATERDRVEFEIGAAAAELGIPVGTSTDVELKRLLRRAARTAVPPTATRVEDAVHLINAKPEDRERAARHARVHVHAFDPPRPLIARIAEAWQSDPWSEEDAIDDPFLDHLVARWSEKENPLEVAHAFACLAEAKTFMVTRVSPHADDWRAGLARILGEVLPGPGVLIMDPRGEVRVHDRRDPVPCLAVPRARLETSASDECSRARETLGPLLIQGEDACTVTPHRVSWTDLQRERDRDDYGRQRAPYVPPRVVFDSLGASDTERWFGLLERSPALGGTMEEPAYANGTVSVDWGAGRDITPAWPVVERELGIQWMVLRRALRSDEAVRVGSGVVLIPVGRRVVMELDVRAHTSRTGRPDCVAALEATLSGTTELRWQRSLIEKTSRRDGRSAQTEHLRALPGTLRLLGHGVAATVRYHSAPLL